jgi:hypothetical protein
VAAGRKSRSRSRDHHARMPDPVTMPVGCSLRPRPQRASGRHPNLKPSGHPAVAGPLAPHPAPSPPFLTIHCLQATNGVCLRRDPLKVEEDSDQPLYFRLNAKVGPIENSQRKVAAKTEAVKLRNLPEHAAKVD